MKVRIGTKLMGGFLISVAVTIVVGGVALLALAKANDSANTVLEVDVRNLVAVDTMQNRLAEARRNEKEFFLFSELHDEAKQQEYYGKVKTGWEGLAQDAVLVESVSQGCRGCHAENHVTVAIAGVTQSGDVRGVAQLVAPASEKLDRLTGLMLSGQSYQQANEAYLDYRGSVRELEASIAALHQNTVHMLETREHELLGVQGGLRNVVIAALAAAVLLALALAIVLTRSITKPVGVLAGATRQIAAGDLSQRVPVASRDELGELAGFFNQMTESLQASRAEIQQQNEELETTNEELRASNEELRATEEELRATNDELREAQEKVVRTERLAAIGQLAGGVGHELRNPLGAIKNAVYYLRGKIAKSDLAQTDPRSLEFIKIIDEEVDASNKIITELLGFAKVGKPAAVSTGRIDKAVDEAIDRAKLPENVQVFKDLNSLPDVTADHDMMRQVFLNIIQNARDAMPDGGQLRITGRDDQGFVEIEIKDSGVGIPADIAKKVFDPLFTTKAKGIGLGLAVCQAVVERHGGRITVASGNGSGTAFTIRIPVNSVERPAGAVTA